MEAPPTAEPEPMANWPTASLSNNRRELSLSLEAKSLHTEKKSEQKQQQVQQVFSLLPAGRASLNPQLDAEQTHSGIITHLNLFVVHRAED